MKKLSLFLLCLSLLACGKETIEMNKLELRDNKYYEKETGDLYSGDVTKKYANGNIAEKGHLKRGIKHGEWEYYYENGVLKSKVKYDHGLEEGKVDVYSEKGRLQTSITYKKGKYDGACKKYDENGILILDEQYIDGIRN